MVNSTLIAAIATILSRKFADEVGQPKERHPDCMSSYGPIGCNRVRCQLGKKCQAAIDADRATAKGAAGLVDGALRSATATGSGE